MTRSHFAVKPHIMDMMASRFPEYRYVFTKEPRYFFQSQPIDGIYEFVVFQRDGRAGALYIDLVATYALEWDGFAPYPLGGWTSLAKLVKAGGKGYVDALEEWYSYENSKNQLISVLDQIASHLISHGKHYFLHIRKVLQSDRILQAGLQVLREVEPFSPRSLIELDADLKRANYRLSDTKNGTLDQMAREIKARLNFLTRLRAEEIYVRKVACELLFLGRMKEILAKS
jgi:hypothetical protein